MFLKIITRIIAHENGLSPSFFFFTVRTLKVCHGELVLTQPRYRFANALGEHP